MIGYNCQSPGCPHLAYGSRFCEHCKPARNRERERQRLTRHQRGYSTAWEKFRKLVLHRQPLCQWPGCTQLATDVDHIIPKAAGGQDTLENCQGLCHSHHSLKTVKQDGGFGRPKCVDVNHIQQK
jgi:5-methylcytosine-specific restriction protein A